MNKIFLASMAIFSLATLSACAPSDDQKAKLLNSLPSGCTVSDIGQYGEFQDLIVVNCPKQATLTSYYENRYYIGGEYPIVAYDDYAVINVKG